MNTYEKLTLSLRYWILGIAAVEPEYYKVHLALDFMRGISTDTRKDGFTPEAKHPLEVAMYLKTVLSDCIYKPETLCVALLHDIVEDYDVPIDTIRAKWGERVSTSVELLTKVKRMSDGTQVKTNLDLYLDFISQDAIASVVKGADRINNMATMVGVFSKEKMQSYLTETNTILKYTKLARRNFPQQEPVYQNIRTILNTQSQMASYIVEHIK